MPEKAEKLIPLVECFGPTAQGEGALCGQVSYFLRTGNCSFRCAWCDSMHAVDAKQVRENAEYLAQDQIIERICALAPSARRGATWVTISGGDPVIWELNKVVLGLKIRGFRVAVETQGALWRDWLESCDLVTCSPKPPSSGMKKKFRPKVIQKYATRLGDRLVLKVVAFDDEDLDWAAKIHDWMPRVKFFLSSGTPTSDGGPPLSLKILNSYKKLVEEVLKRPSLHDVTVLPQVHALIWQRELGR